MFSDDYTMAQSAMKHIEKSEIGRGIYGEKAWGRKSFERMTRAFMPQCVCVLERRKGTLEYSEHTPLQYPLQ